MRFGLNGTPVHYEGPMHRRLSDVLRDDFGINGVKVGCNAGDCGACTVLIDGHQFCACLTPVAQVEGKIVVSVEGLIGHGAMSRVQKAFHKHGAAQCGICTPGMIMAASDLIADKSAITEQDVMDAIGGVLCRCTGYRKIVDAVLDAANVDVAMPEPAPSGAAFGARAPKVDGLAKITGAEAYGADHIPHDALWVRIIRSPHASARFTLGDMTAFLKANPGIDRVLTAADVPSNGYGIYPDVKDQPVLADGLVRYRGEAVVALLGEREAVEAASEASLPISWQVLPPVIGVKAAAAKDAPQLHASKPGNLLTRGFLRHGEPEAALHRCAYVARGHFETAFVEHAYIEPEAGWARRVGDRLEIHATTQSPYMDRDEVAIIMRMPKESIRIVPTACGGGFGGKLDLSVQPLIALGAWLTGKPVACVYTRPESMAASTKRHPASIVASFGCDAQGKLQAAVFEGDYDTGAYASWGPTVANRVPVHASGPYQIPHVLAESRALFTNAPPSGAFRGFGVPQAAIAHEALIDELASRCGIDRLEFRLINALRAGDETSSGQKLEHSVGMAACLEALKPRWQAWRRGADTFNKATSTKRRGIGIGCSWYGIGNTSLSNPSTMRIGISDKGQLTLYNGAVDIGQGSNTIMTQIAADALGLDMADFKLVMGDTDLTADGGKTSASRQTFVSGKAVETAGRDLRQKILRLANAGPTARLALDGARLIVRDGDAERMIDLSAMPHVAGHDVLLGEGTFDPPTTPLDANGQGIPYATYGFAAQIALVEVDTELGVPKVLKMAAAHDVGRAVNPLQVEGQIHGGIAQGLGLALMEEYIPGRTENLHDYLIPTAGDMPEIECFIVEDAEPLGPSGAKGVGEPSLVATAPAILGAIHDATGFRITRVPALPHRIRDGLRAKEKAA